MTDAAVTSKPTMTRRSMVILAVCIVVLLVAFDWVRYFHTAGRDGLRAVTGMELPEDIRIVEYKVEGIGGANDPDHYWLLASDRGSFAAIAERRSEFMLSGASFMKVLGDVWPELDERYRDQRIGETIMGIGTGTECLFISEDGRWAILYAFRS